MRPPSKVLLRPITLYAALVMVGLAALAAAHPARAASPNGPSLVVTLDHSAQLHINGQAQSVVVGNPAIADVTVVDSHTLYVTGKSYGVTDVAVVDALGRTLFHNEIQVAPSNASMVAVWQGGRRLDYSCTPRCEASTRATTAQATPVSGVPM